jgi:peptidoglycan L-alanyl-D-glutamate endopeptidase CwlK
MPYFGHKSKRCLSTVHPLLQKVLNEAINHYDFSIIYGHRGRLRQNDAFVRGNSKLKWPNSRHNSKPAEAFDVIPHPYGFDSSDEEFYRMATYILSSAAKLGVALDWGGHWTSFKDLAHFELNRSIHG